MIKYLRSLIRDARTRTDYYDYHLLASIILLMSFGFIILYSASAYDAATNANMEDSMWYLVQQVPKSIIAFLAAAVISRYDYHELSRVAPLIYWAAIVLMGLVKSPLGVTANGARRWLKLGIQFQPAEIAKIAVIVAVPYVIVKMGREFGTLKGTVKVLGYGMFPAGVAFVFTDNLSTALIIAAITAGIVFVSHPRTAPFIALLVGAFSGMGGIVYYVSRLPADSNAQFRFRRIQVWLDPERYSEEGGYQVLQGLYAIGSGGLFGKGLGNSAQKLGSIPEAQNDMIFTIICEELGLFGMVLVLGLFAYLLYRLFFIAQNAPDLFGSLMATGVFIHIALQVILNIAVVTRLIPTTGITLPFFSYGGSSVIFLMMELAIALSVARRIPIK